MSDHASTKTSALPLGAASEACAAQAMSADLTRRRLLGAFAAGALAGAAPTRSARAAAPTPIVVMTSYQSEPMAIFEREFERAHPEYRLQIVWRMPVDALPWLRRPDHGVDVYWGASPRTFAALAADGAFAPLTVDRSGLVDRIGRTQISDPQGRYAATEMAGYGFAVNADALKAAGLAMPADWDALADPRWAGQIALPIPSRVGFAPPIVDLVLQAYGWEAGWALWSAIAGNAMLVDAGSTFVTDEVASGRVALGISIDFFVAAAIANGKRVSFAYPRHTALNPGHVALMQRAPNPEGARVFAGFVLSDAGQRLLLDPDVRKLPARESAYADARAPSFNPFAAAREGRMEYDDVRGRPRLALVAAVFEQWLIADHDELKRLWRRVAALDARGRDTRAVRAVLTRAPLTEAEADDPKLQRQFVRELEGTPRTEPRAAELAWRTATVARRREADALLTALEAA